MHFLIVKNAYLHKSIWIDFHRIMTKPLPRDTSDEKDACMKSFYFGKIFQSCLKELHETKKQKYHIWTRSFRRVSCKKPKFQIYMYLTCIPIIMLFAGAPWACLLLLMKMLHKDRKIVKRKSRQDLTRPNENWLYKPDQLRHDLPIVLFSARSKIPRPMGSKSRLHKAMQDYTDNLFARSFRTVLCKKSKFLF